MTWLNVGNGWRNLYLLSCMAQMFALGCLFATKRWFSKKSRAACFLTGVASTPFVQYLWVLILSLAWPDMPKLVYIGMPPLLSCVSVLTLAVVNLRRAKELLLQGFAFAKRCLHFDKPALAALCFALCIVILIAPVCVRFMSSMNAVGGGDAGEYLALGLHYCENRDISVLLEKEETVGHFRGHSHFPSLELYMSYGLFHTGGEYGYPYDKPVFTGIGMLIFYAACAYGALLLHFCREKKVCVLLGAVLFNLIPQLYFSVSGAPRDVWRILALLLSVLVFSGITEKGNRKAYVGKLILSFAVCFTVMSAHVVCFVVLPFIVVAWVLWRVLEAHMTEIKGAGKALLRSVGIALAGAAGTLAAFSGNIWCFLKWGEMSPWRLMTTFTDAPWYDMYMDIEYKLEETTTHLNFFEDLDAIIMGYASPVGTWGLYTALMALVCVIAGWILSRIRMRRTLKEVLASAPDGSVGVLVTNRTKGAETLSMLAFCALTAILTLAPMSGVLDSPLYSFSGSFVKLPRYTLQWFFLCNVMICALLAALIEHWPEWLAKAKKLPVKPWMKTVPAWLCAALCLLGMVKGLNQTGYTNTFYRYSRDVMEDQSILLDGGFRDRYGLLMEVAEKVGDDQKILITRSGYQYALGARGYVLISNPIVELLNLPLEEVEPRLQELNAAMLATEPDFWDERYFPLSTLNTYLESLPDEQVIETETMRLYLFDPALVEAAQAALKRFDFQEEKHELCQMRRSAPARRKPLPCMR